MKKSKFLIFAVFCFFFFNIEYIKATSYTCVYDFTVENSGWFAHNESLEFTVDPTNKTITWPDKFINDYEVYFLDYYFNDKFTVEYIVDSLKGGCVSHLIVGPFVGEMQYAIIFEESHLYLLEEAPYAAGGGYHLPEEFFNDHQIMANITQLITGTLDEDKSSGKAKSGGFGCDFYDNTMEILKNLNLNDLAEKQIYNVRKDSLKAFCNDVMEFSNIGLSYCISSCLSLSDEIEIIEESQNIENSCGFSSRLIIWIGNIIRWMKYLVPVLVIVLGILDFIKALSGDKDDEMKKAQGRFVKRLIAAALIFIIPFVIEFVLDVMGFDRYIEGCGIIDL